MTDKNKTPLLIGLILIIVAFVCVAGIFYVMGNESQSQIASLEGRLSNLINEKAADQMSSQDYDRAKGAVIDIEKLAAKAKTLYGPGELSRKDGILWIDRKTSKAIVTLGAIHGLVVGNYLDVYEDSTQLGSVRVDSLFDTISYVVPVDKTLNDFAKNYYRVLIRQ